MVFNQDNSIIASNGSQLPPVTSYRQSLMKFVQPNIAEFCIKSRVFFRVVLLAVVFDSQYRDTEFRRCGHARSRHRSVASLCNCCRRPNRQKRPNGNVSKTAATGSISSWPFWSSSRCSAKLHRTLRMTASSLRTPDVAVFDLPMPTLSQFNTRLGDRSFSVAEPKLWNSLPATLRQPDVELGRFRRLLKTFLFS